MKLSIYGPLGQAQKGNAIKLIVFTLTPTSTNGVSVRPSRPRTLSLRPFDLNTVFGSLSVTNKFPMCCRCCSRFSWPSLLFVCFFIFLYCHTQNIEGHIVWVGVCQAADINLSIPRINLTELSY